jgi:hypothetical protein
MKKLSLLCLAVTPLLADDAMQMRNLENRVSALEQTRRGNGSINPAVHPTIKKGAHLWGQVEALYFRPTEDNLAYTIQNDTADKYFNTPLKGKTKNISYDWDWGVRAGIGYDLPHDGWDLFLNWTWFQTKAHASNTTDIPHSANVQPWTSGSGVFGFNVGEAMTHFVSARSSLHWALVDLELGREFMVSKWLSLRPFIGARGAWISRNFKIHYSGDVGIRGDDYPLLTNEVWNHLHNQYRGGGLRGGISSAWKFGYGFSLYGELDLALLYGSQKLQQKQRQLGLPVIEPPLQLINAKNHWTTLRPMLDIGAGLRWDKFFCESKYRIRFQLGWEQHLLFGFENDQNFIKPGPHQYKYSMGQGNLGLSGVSFQTRLDF